MFINYDSIIKSSNGAIINHVFWHDCPIYFLKNLAKQPKNSPVALKKPGSLKSSDNKKIQALYPNRESNDGAFMTTDHGVKINDDQNSLKAGERGSTLLEDFILREKITHFDYERIPERIVHARGSAAHGVFELYEPMSDFTKADFLNNTSKKHRFRAVLNSCRISWLIRPCKRRERFRGKI